MENQNTNKTEYRDCYDHKNHRLGKIVAGLIVVAAGSLLLARQMGLFIPGWIFSWEMLLITIGIYHGARRSFRTRGWLIPVIIGCVFLLDDIIPGIIITPYFWPLFIIGIGLFMILSPRRKWGRHRHWRDYRDYTTNESETSLQEDRIDVNCVFSGVKKNIISKDFKGGEINCVFGGAQINLSQADINGKAIIELNNVFGGTELIIPPHWEVQTKIDTILGGVNDKRPAQKDLITDSGKVLVLKGSCVFGGVEIKSF